jgi:spore coat polysaccharide biosynthesis protein SpsF
MKDLDGQPVLAWVVKRCLRTGWPVVVATPDTEDNQPIWDWCEQEGIGLFKGHPTDLTKRYLDCALKLGADPIIRITADCPFINPEVITRLAEGFTKGFRMYSDQVGWGTEIFTLDLLKEAATHGPDEHCTTWMIQHHGLNYSFPDIPVSEHSLTLDTQDDYERLQALAPSFRA